MPPVQEVKAPNRRLDSWKEIAAFFARDERTVKRWEKERLLPVHRLPGGSRARVFAFTDELERWMHSLEAEDANGMPEKPEPAEEQVDGLAQSVETADNQVDVTGGHPPRRSWVAMTVVAILLAAGVATVLTHRQHFATHVHNSNGGKSSATVLKPAKASANPEAEELYLQGRYYWNKRTPEDLNKAVDYFTQAIVHDPSYAQAYVGLADCYNLLREFAAMPNEEAFPRALAAAQKAVELDDSSAEAHASLAFDLLYWNWDIPGAEREFRRAMQLNPDYATAHQWYANFLEMSGRYPEALQEISRAEHLDPASSAILADRTLILYNLGRADESIAELKELEKSQPDFYSPHVYLASMYLNEHHYPGFFSELKHAGELSHNAQQIAIARAAEEGYKTGGENGLLTSMLREQEELYNQGKLSPFFVAEAYAQLNQTGKALHYLQLAYEKHDPLFLSIRIDKALLPLHRDPAFRALELKFGLPPAT